MSDDIASLVIEVKSDGVDKAKRSLADLSSQGQKTERSLGNVSTSAKSADSSLAGMAGSVKNLIGAYVGLSSVIGFAKISDEYTKFNAQLKIATGTQKEFAQALKDVNAIAISTQSSISSISTLYARLNTSLKDIGVSQANVAKIAETVGLSLKVAGASAAESSSAMLQLSQAFGSGVLRGEEFNAVMESAPNLMRALAESIGVPIGQLRQLASDGQITADVLTKAFSNEDLLKKLREQAKEVNTVSGAFTLLGNEFTLTVGKFAEDSGAITALTTVINGLADSLKRVRENLPTRDETLNLAKVLPGAFPGIGVVKDTLKATARIRLNYGNANGDIASRLRAEKAKNGNSIGGAGAITGNGSYAPDFNATIIEEMDVNKINKRLEEANKAKLDSQREYNDFAKRQREEALKEIQNDIDFEIDQKEALYQFEKNAVKELEKQKEYAYKKEQDMIAKQLSIRQDIANRNMQEAQQESERIEKERLKDFEDSMSGISQVFREGFANMVNGGKTSWKSFTKSLVTTFKTTVADAIYKMFAQPFVVKILASIAGLGVSGAANASFVDGLMQPTGSGGIFGTISEGLQSLNSNVVGSIEKLGAFLSNGQGGLADKIGGALGQYSSQIASALTFAPAVMSLLKGDIKGAAFQGAGAALGTFLGGPIGGALGSFIGGAIGGLFGGSGRASTKRYVATTYASNKNGVYTDGGVTGGGNGLLTQAVQPLKDMNKQFIMSLQALLGAFGKNDAVSLSSMFNVKNRSYWSIQGSINGNAFGEGFTGSKKSANQAQEIFAQFIEKSLGSVLVRAIQLSSLTDGIKSLFNGLTDKTQVVNMINASIALGNAQDELASRFGLTADQAGKVSVASGLSGDKLAEFANKLAQSAAAFATVGDVMVKAKARLKDGLGSEVPESLKAFDAVLKGIDKTTQEGIDSFSAMFSLRDQFIAFQSSLDSLKFGVKGALLGIVSDSEKQAMMQADLAKAFNELGLNIPTSIQDLITLGKSIDFTSKEGLDLAYVFPTLVNAFMETQDAVDSLIDSLRDINEFTTLVDFNRYKGLATNYGNSFANRLTDGAQVTYGASNNTSVSLPVISPSNNTTISTSDPNLLQAIQTLSAKVDALQLAADKSATHTKRAADVLVNVSPNGNAIQTEAVV